MHNFPLILGLSIIAAAHADCKYRVPFSNDIVGRSFSKLDDCYRPIAFSMIRVFPRLFTYEPNYINRLPRNCQEKWVFHFRPDADPFLVHLPNIDDFTMSEAQCKKMREQKSKRYFPGSKQFTKGVREMVKGIKVIRDFGCYTDEDGFIVQRPGRAFDNADVEGIRTYLLSVAYRYGFCAE